MYRTAYTRIPGLGAALKADMQCQCLLARSEGAHTVSGLGDRGTLLYCIVVDDTCTLTEEQMQVWSKSPDCISKAGLHPAHLRHATCEVFGPMIVLLRYNPQ